MGVVATRFSKVMALLWTGWIYMSSCFVITRFEFADAVCRLTGVQNPNVRTFIQQSWWTVDRLYHIVEFGIWSTLLLASFRLIRKRPFAVIPLTLLAGALDEYHQFLVNPVAAHTYDIFIDAIGAAVAVWVYVRIQIKRDLVSPSAIH